MLFDRFDQIRIVSLPERTDRRKLMLAELRRVGLHGDPRVGFFDALKMPDAGLFRSAGSHGCYLGHLEILRKAARSDQNVLILQDDCRFLPAIHDYELPPEWDVVYGGYYPKDPDDLHHTEIVGAHFMGFSARAAKAAAAYLEKLLDPGFPPDPTAAAEPDFNPAIRPPIDGACVWFRRAHPGLITVFELLSVQRSSRSDIAPPKFFDRIRILRPAIGLARRIKAAAVN